MTYTMPSPKESLRESPGTAAGFGDRLREGARHVASDRLTMFLALLLVTVSVLTLQAFNEIDAFFNGFPRLESETLRVFLIYWPDTVASRAVALPVLGLVALFLALRTRSWRPLVLSAGAFLAMVFVVGSMKLFFGRAHPRTGDPAGFFVDVGQNFSFPSGHGANAILIYGVALYLIVRYRAVRPHIAVHLGLILAALTTVQCLVSIYLRFHWASDLLTGMVAGALVLRMVIVVDRLIPESWSVGWWPFLPSDDPRPPTRLPRVASEVRRIHRADGREVWRPSPSDVHRHAPRRSAPPGPNRALPARLDLAARRGRPPRGERGPPRA
jgi:membrane-associated phospholipid phosphatase